MHAGGQNSAAQLSTPTHAKHVVRKVLGMGAGEADAHLRVDVCSKTNSNEQHVALNWQMRLAQGGPGACFPWLRVLPLAPAKQRTFCCIQQL